MSSSIGPFVNTAAFVKGVFWSRWLCFVGFVVFFFFLFFVFSLFFMSVKQGIYLQNIMAHFIPKLTPECNTSPSFPSPISNTLRPKLTNHFLCF